MAHARFAAPAGSENCAVTIANVIISIGPEEFLNLNTL